MDATTLPTLLLGGDPQGDPQDTYAVVGRVARPAGRPRPGRRACPALPAGRRRRRGRRHRRRAGPRGGAMTRARWVLPAGQRRARGLGGRRRRERRRLDSTPACMRGRCCPGRSADCRPAARELIVVPLSGFGRRPVHRLRGHRVTVPARRPASVFDGPTDVAYVPRDSDLVLEATEPCRVALAVAVVPAGRRAGCRPSSTSRAADVPVELRGAGQASREVRNFGVPGVLDAESLIACEVITPAGNWSSYPPHKHDTDREGVESQLEEIYYHEVQAAGRRDSRAPTRSATCASTARRSARSTCSPRCGPATSSSCPTAGTARRWPLPATTCTTSTSWRAPARSAPG